MDLITGLIGSASMIAVSFGLGYYVGGRGFAGVKIDLDNTKRELEKVKDLVTTKAIPQAVTIVTPVGDQKVTDTVTAGTTPSQ